MKKLITVTILLLAGRVCAAPPLITSSKQIAPDVSNGIVTNSPDFNNAVSSITTLQTNLGNEITNRTNAETLLVPYSGATSGVNLGSQALTTGGSVTAATFNGSGAGLTTIPANKLDNSGITTSSLTVSQSLLLTMGTPGAGKVLTSDGAGNASWQAAVAGGGGATLITSHALTGASDSFSFAMDTATYSSYTIIWNGAITGTTTSGNTVTIGGGNIFQGSGEGWPTGFTPTSVEFLDVISGIQAIPLISGQYFVTKDWSGGTDAYIGFDGTKYADIIYTFSSGTPASNYNDLVASPASVPVTFTLDSGLTLTSGTVSVWGIK